MNLVFLNGEYLAKEKASVSVLDRGFLFGDAIYEFIPVYDDVTFHAERHITRLSNSLDGILMENPYTLVQWHTIFKKLLAQNTLELSHIYIQVSRGATSVRNHAIPEQITPTIFVAIFPSPSRATFINGMHVATLLDQRWQNCRIKATTLLPNVLAKEHAKTNNAQDCIFVNSEGFATEGTSSNLFIVKDNIVYTTPLSANILPGITRSVVIDLLKQNNIALKEKMLTKNELVQADEVWLSSSSIEVAPVTMVDGQPIRNGSVGPMWQSIDKLFQQHKQAIVSQKKEMAYD
jgi:D-alanine transaminase